MHYPQTIIQNSFVYQPSSAHGPLRQWEEVTPEGIKTFREVVGVANNPSVGLGLYYSAIEVHEVK